MQTAAAHKWDNVEPLLVAPEVTAGGSDLSSFIGDPPTGYHTAFPPAQQDVVRSITGASEEGSAHHTRALRQPSAFLTRL